MVTCLEAKIQGLDKKKRILEATLVGTVFSGHPTRTTYGNTLRVILYLKFTFFLAGIDKYSLFICGDDCLAIIESDQ